MEIRKEDPATCNQSGSIHAGENMNFIFHSSPTHQNLYGVILKSFLWATTIWKLSSEKQLTHAPAEKFVRLHWKVELIVVVLLICRHYVLWFWILLLWIHIIILQYIIYVCVCVWVCLSVVLFNAFACLRLIQRWLCVYLHMKRKCLNATYHRTR